jgi:hypothetical protein
MEFIQVRGCLVLHSLYLLVLVQKLATWLYSIIENQLYLKCLGSMFNVIR